MRKAATNANRMSGWGDSLTNQLPSTSRRQRKRQASKRRRVMLRRELLDLD
jgi:hypothetical protein